MRRKWLWALGGVSALGGAAAAIAYFGTIVPAQNELRGERALNRGKQLAAAMVMYTDSWDGAYPPADQWQTLLGELLLPGEESAFDAEGTTKTDIAFRTSAEAKTAGEIDEPGQFALLFDSDQGTPNAHGELNQLPKSPRYNGKYRMVNAEGRAMLVPRDDIR
jgi:hypothetical protein